MLNKFELHGDVNIQSLVGGVDVLSHKEDHVSSLLKYDVRQQRTTVLL